MTTVTSLVVTRISNRLQQLEIDDHAEQQDFARPTFHREWRPPADHRAATVLVARQSGVVAGLDLARLAFQLIDPAIEMRLERNDGAVLAPGEVIATVLEVERLAVAVLAEAMSALGDPFSMLAFASDGRDDVEMTTVKAFNEPYDRACVGRLAGLSSGLST